MALCNPDFNSEEVSSVKRNKNEIWTAVEDMAEHLPKEDPGKGDKLLSPISCQSKLSSDARSDLPRRGNQDMDTS